MESGSCSFQQSSGMERGCVSVITLVFCYSFTYSSSSSYPLPYFFLSHQGAPPEIPPNADLHFIVKLKKIK